MARTGDAKYAAEKAGYAHPAVRAYGNLRKPAVQAEIVVRSEARLYNDLVPLALETLFELMAADKPYKIRLDAAGKVMTHAKGTAAALTRDEAEDTLDDIRRKIRMVDQALADLKVIEHDPTGGAESDLYA